MDGYRIVLAEPNHVNALPAIERAAATLFDDTDLPPALRDETIAVDELLAAAKQGHLWVAVSPTDEPVAFALVSASGDTVHLEELDVHPSHARQGIGTALVRTVCDWARGQGFAAVTLTTFRHLAWNAPFYARNGFVCLGDEELTLALRQRLQPRLTWDSIPTKRIAMQFELT